MALSGISNAGYASAGVGIRAGGVGSLAGDSLTTSFVLRSLVRVPV
jgi:hypothetical protein